MTGDATEIEVDGAALDGQAWLAGREERAPFLGRGAPQGTELNLGGDHQTGPSRGDGKKTPARMRLRFFMAAGLVGATFGGRGGGSEDHAKGVQGEGDVRDQEEHGGDATREGPNGRGVAGLGGRDGGVGQQVTHLPATCQRGDNCDKETKEAAQK